MATAEYGGVLRVAVGEALVHDPEAARLALDGAPQVVDDALEETTGEGAVKERDRQVVGHGPRKRVAHVDADVPAPQPGGGNK